MAGVAFFLLILASWMMYQQINPRALHPSDESMIANFQEHRDAFDKLVAMTNTDHEVHSISFLTDEYRVYFEDRAWPADCSNCFSAQRWSEYKTAFAGLGNVKASGLSKEVGSVRIPDTFSFTVVDANYEYLVSEKGYAYSPREPPGVIESLNGMGFDSKGIFYKKIADHWYLYHDWAVGTPE